MKRLIVGGLAALAISLGAVSAPVAGAEPCYGGSAPNNCEHEFDWTIPYIEALQNHGLGGLVEEHDLPIILAARDVCQGASAHDIAHRSDHYLTPAQVEQIADAVYDDVCPEMAQ